MASRYSKNPPRPIGADNKPLAPQGRVHVIGSYAPEEVARRMSMATRANSNKALLYPGGGDAENYRVTRYEPMFGVKSKRGIARNGRQAYESVISAFNGINMEGKASEEDLARDYYFFGFALNDYDPNDRSRVEQGVTCAVAGPVQVPFNGKETIYAGDTIRWVPPSFDPSKRTGRKFDGQPPGKLLAEFKRLDWKDIRKVAQVTFLDAITPAMSAMPLAAAGDRPMSSAEQRALHYTQEKLFTLLEGIRNLMARGFLIPITPEVRARAAVIEGDNGDGTTLFNRLLGGDPPTNAAASNVKTDIVTRTNMSFMRGDQNVDNDYFLPLLAYKSGMASTLGPLSGHVARTQCLERAQLYLASRIGAIGTPNTESRSTRSAIADLRTSLLSTMSHVYMHHNQERTYRPSFEKAYPNSSPTPVREYLRAARDAPILSEQVQAEHKAAIAGTAVGMCMSSASPDTYNPKIDVLTNFAGGNVSV